LLYAVCVCVCVSRFMTYFLSSSWTFLFCFTLFALPFFVLEIIFFF